LTPREYVYRSFPPKSIFHGRWCPALFVAPASSKIRPPQIEPEHHGKVELAIMFGMARHDAAVRQGVVFNGRSSPVLAFCTSHELHAIFVQQLVQTHAVAHAHLLPPVLDFRARQDFADGTVSLVAGLVFTVALLGKLAVRFMVPNFTQSKTLRGCICAIV
jgi:hypothetical protein